MKDLTPEQTKEISEIRTELQDLYDTGFWFGFAHHRVKRLDALNDKYFSLTGQHFTPVYTPGPYQAKTKKERE